MIDEYYCKTTILDNNEMVFATYENCIEYLAKTGTDQDQALRTLTQCAKIMRHAHIIRITKPE